MYFFCKKILTDLPQKARFLGLGWRIISSTNKPIGQLNAVLRVITVALIIPTDVNGVIQLFKHGNPTLSANIDLLQSFVDLEFQALKADIFKLMTRDSKLKFEEAEYLRFESRRVNDVVPLGKKTYWDNYSYQLWIKVLLRVKDCGNLLTKQESQTYKVSI